MSKQEESSKPSWQQHGPANPFARRVAELRMVLVKSITPDDLGMITQALTDKAKQGHVGAAKLLFQYVFGKPVANPHPDHLDQDEMQAFQAAAIKAEVCTAMEATPVEPVLKVMRELFPANGDKFFKDLQARLRERMEEERATVNKRPAAGQPAPMSVPSVSGITETEALRLVTPPTDDRAADDRRAANRCRT